MIRIKLLEVIHFITLFTNPFVKITFDFYFSCVFFLIDDFIGEAVVLIKDLLIDSNTKRIIQFHNYKYNKEHNGKIGSLTAEFLFVESTIKNNFKKGIEHENNENSDIISKVIFLFLVCK